MVKAIPADIVVVSNSGYPLDQNIYQSVKGMTAAEATCKENGAKGTSSLPTLKGFLLNVIYPVKEYRRFSSCGKANGFS